MKPESEFRRQVKLFLKIAGISQQELCVVAGLKPRKLANAFCGHDALTVQTMTMVCEAMETIADRIVRGEWPLDGGRAN